MEINWSFSDFYKKIAIVKGGLSQTDIVNILFLGTSGASEGVDSSVASKYLNGKIPVKKYFLSLVNTEKCSIEELSKRMDTVFLVEETAKNILHLYDERRISLSLPEYQMYLQLYNDNKCSELVARAFLHAVFMKTPDFNPNVQEQATNSGEPCKLPSYYDQIIIDLNETVKRANGKVRIYMGDEMNFNSVYVLPSLTVKEERDIEASIRSADYSKESFVNPALFESWPTITMPRSNSIKNTLASFYAYYDYTPEELQAKLWRYNEYFSDYLKKNRELGTYPSLLLRSISTNNTGMQKKVPQPKISAFDNSKPKIEATERNNAHNEGLQPRVSAFDNSEQKIDATDGIQAHKEKENKTLTRGEILNNRRRRIHELFLYNNITYVVGGAGYGKSLFLRKLCTNPQIIKGYSEDPLLVLYGDIKKMLDASGTPLPITDYLEKCLIAGTMKKSEQIAPHFLENCLSAGRCLILLDALDEVGSDYRSEIHELIISSFTKEFPGNKVCITSRDRGFIPQKIAECYYIDPIGINDIEYYIDNFISLKKFDINSKNDFLEQASALTQNGFIQGFLTLSLLLAIYKEDQEIPTSKRLLYKRCFEFIANRREQAKRLMRNSKTLEAYDWGTLELLMSEGTFAEFAKLGAPNNQNIAEATIKSAIYDLYGWLFKSETLCDIKTEQLLQFCAERTDVFVPSNQSNLEYRFFHRSFFDYFYAKYLELRLQDPTQILNNLYSLDVDSEIVELLLSMYSYRNPRFIKELFAKAFFCLEDQALSLTPNPKILDTLVSMLGAVGSIEYNEQFLRLLFHNRTEFKNMSCATPWRLIQAMANSSPECVLNEYKQNAAQLEKEAKEEIIKFLHKELLFAKAWANDVSKLPKIQDERYEKEAAILQMKLLLPSEQTSGFRMSSVKLICLGPDGRKIITSIFLEISDIDWIKQAVGFHTKPAKRVFNVVSKVRELPSTFQESFITWIMLNA